MNRKGITLKVDPNELLMLFQGLDAIWWSDNSLEASERMKKRFLNKARDYDPRLADMIKQNFFEQDDSQ